MKLNVLRTVMAIAVLGVLTFTACQKDNKLDNEGDKITSEELPAESRSFLAENFQDATVVSAIKLNKPEADGTVYETKLSNDFEVDFDEAGDWTGINGNGQAVPRGAIPQKIFDYVAEHYPSPIYIEEIDVENNGYEVDLSNGIDLFFDLDGNFVSEEFDGDDDEDETTILLSDLPQKAQDFISTYFSGVQVLSVTKETEDDDDDENEVESIYEVKLQNGFELGFDAEGNWTEIDGNDQAVPDGAVPGKILTYVQDNFAAIVFIESIEKDEEGYEVELSDDTDLAFDLNGNFLSSDKDNDDGDDDGDDDGNDDGETVIAFDQLPQAAKDLIETNFPTAQAIKVTENSVAEDDGTIYEVELDNGFELSFDADGNWTDIDGENQAVPDALVPANVLSYIQSTYPSLYVESIEKENYGYKVGLSNDVDLKFDADGPFIGIDD